MYVKSLTQLFNQNILFFILKTCSLLQAACSAFCRVTVTAVPNFSVLCTICQSFALSPLTSDQFEFQLMLDQNQLLCLDLQNFKSLGSGDVHQNFWSSESLALGLQNLQVFRSWRRSSELLSSETSALDFW